MEHKTSSAITRTAYLQCMLATYKGWENKSEEWLWNDLFFVVAEDSLSSLIPLHSTLMASYERGLNQSTLINCVHEALLATLIMINIAQMNSAYGKNSTNFI